MPYDNYNFDYEPSGTFVDINKECFTFDAPVDVDRNLKESVTFITQTYYRTNFVTPNKCCCKGGGCEPTPPGPCPPPPPPPPVPTPCPVPSDFPEGCFEGVYCNEVLYETIEDALEDNPCADELLVGCGTYSLPLKLINDVCIKGRGSNFTYLSTVPGQKIVDDNVSIMDVSFVACEDGYLPDPGIVLEASNFYLKDCDFRYEDHRQINLYVTGKSARVSAINCDFTASANYGIKVVDFKGILSLTSDQFNNPVAVEIVSSPCSEFRSVACGFIGQVTYDCASAEFNGCDFLVGSWKKINIKPFCNTEFVSCTFDNQTKTGWVDASRGMKPILGMHAGCKKHGIVYKINNSVYTDGNVVDKTVVFLSEGKDKEPGQIFIDGVEQEIDDSNWGKF